jgi:bifunctional DNA-binding transcriptional regulator/antitoxin component of YhaV-PrlF toxin-antitoxin module
VTQKPEIPEMGTLLVTSKGQVTLRRDVLQHLGVQPGDKISVDKLPNGRIQVRAAAPAGKISDVFNMLKKGTVVSLSIDEMNKITASGWAREK